MSSLDMADVQHQEMTAWRLYGSSMAETSVDEGVSAQAQSDQGQRSNSRDQDWNDFVKTLEQDQGPASNDNMNLNLFGLEDPAQFGAANDMSDFDPTSATTTNGALSSISDQNSAQQPFQSWPAAPPAQQTQNMEYSQYHPFQPGQWTSEQQFEPPLNFGIQGSEGLGIHMPPTSHPVEPHRQSHFHDAYVDHHSPVHPQHPFAQHLNSNGWSHHEQSMVPQDDLFVNEDEDRDGPDPADPCYAQLLYQCLKEAPDCTLSLRELYEWVAQHSQKAKDPKNRGWQNSVRHNLSMNAAFARVPHGNHSGPKKGSLWRLTDEALVQGVISTTRYRKDPKRGKTDRSRFNHSPALNRQASGAKGGRATRDAARMRQRHQRMQRGYSPYLTRSASPMPPQGGFGYAGGPPTPQGASPYFIDADPNNLPPLPMSAPLTPSGGEEFMNDFNAKPLPMSMPMPLSMSMSMPMRQGLPPHQIANFEQCPGMHQYRAGGPGFEQQHFEFLPLEPYHGGPPGGLFGNHDPEMIGTPTSSLMTEESFEVGAVGDVGVGAGVMGQGREDGSGGFQ